MNNKIKQIAVSAAKKAGKALLGEYKNFDRGAVKLKAHHEILTKADLLSEKIIINEIKKNFPGHRILSEEQGYIEAQPAAGRRSLTSDIPAVLDGKDAAGLETLPPAEMDYLWIIDPLDGTTNFSMRNPLWNVSIGAAYRGEIIAGVVYAPVLRELWVAEKNKYVKMNGKKVRVSNNTTKALHAFCHGRDEKFVKKALAYYRQQKLNELDCRQMGSAAIELAYVASGRIESFMIPGVNSWDVAAGALLVREAGGKVTDFNGREWSLGSKDILASNGKVHKELLRVINNK